MSVRYICMCGDVPSGYVAMLALLTWFPSGNPPPDAVFAPSSDCARTRSVPSKLPAASVKAIAGVFSRWSWKFDTNQWICVASAFWFVCHELAVQGSQVQIGVQGNPNTGIEVVA